MKTFHIKNDFNRLYFANYERVTDEEEYHKIMSVLSKSNCTIGNKIMGPDCDLIHCEVDGISFSVIATIDGNGTFLYCDNLEGMEKLEKLFLEE